MRVRLKIRNGDYMVVETDFVRTVNFIETSYGNITGIHALKVCSDWASHYVFLPSQEEVSEIMCNLNKSDYSDLAFWYESTYDASEVELVDMKIDDDLRDNNIPCVIVRHKPGLGAIL